MKVSLPCKFFDLSWYSESCAEYLVKNLKTIEWTLKTIQQLII